MNVNKISKIVIKCWKNGETRAVARGQHPCWMHISMVLNQEKSVILFRNLKAQHIKVLLRSFSPQSIYSSLDLKAIWIHILSKLGVR